MTSNPSASLPAEYLVDHHAIDKQHAEIFELLDSVSSQYQRRKKVSIKRVQRLLVLIGHHFATEEKLAAKAGIAFTEHAKVHNDNLQQMKDSLDLIINGLSDTAAFLSYVEFWFMRHILQFDKPFAAELNAHSSTRGAK